MFVMGTGCGFRIEQVASDASIDTEAPPIDAPPDSRWAVVALSRSSMNFMVTLPFDDAAGFGTACPEQPSPPVRALLSHPTLPYVYAVAAGFDGISVRCSSIVTTTSGTLGAARPIQRLAMDPVSSVGFFTIDGPSSTAIYRFTTAPDGVPTLAGDEVGPSQAGPLTLDVSARRVAFSGANIVWSYPLIGATLELPQAGTYEGAMGCGQGVDLVSSGSYVLQFCSDVPTIRRYNRAPFTFNTTVGMLGAVDRVVALPDDRAIAARISPPDLALIELGAGTPTWKAGPALGSRVAAMNATVDGKMLITARAVDATTSEIAIWSVSNEAIALVDTTMIVGTVTDVTVTAPAP